MCVVPGIGMRRLLSACVAIAVSSAASARRKSLRGFLHVHAKFGRHHFIAAAAGVQLGAQRTEFFDQRSFDKVMDVLGFRVGEPCGIGFSARRDFVECCGDLAAFVLRQNSRADDGSRPRAIERQFLGQHAPVEAPGTLEFVERRVRGAFKKAAPHFLFAGSSHHALAFCGAFLGSSAEASRGTVMGSAKRLMKPSASLGL